MKSCECMQSDDTFLLYCSWIYRSNTISYSSLDIVGKYSNIFSSWIERRNIKI